MLELLQFIDARLFLFFNVQLANPFFDAVMPFITDKHTWYPVWLALIVGLLWKGGRKGRWVVLIALLTVLTADQIVNQLLKPLFGRIRPCIAVEGAHLLIGKKHSFSMPSSHAANFFAVATVFAYYYSRYKAVYWFIAALVAYSRVAVGVHYPFDILAGAVAGFAFGWFWIYVFSYRIKPRGLETGG